MSLKLLRIPPHSVIAVAEDYALAPTPLRPFPVAIHTEQLSSSGYDARGSENVDAVTVLRGPGPPGTEKKNSMFRFMENFADYIRGCFPSIGWRDRIGTIKEVETIGICRRSPWDPTAKRDTFLDCFKQDIEAPVIRDSRNTLDEACTCGVNADNIWMQSRRTSILDNDIKRVFNSFLAEAAFTSLEVLSRLLELKSNTKMRCQKTLNWCITSRVDMHVVMGLLPWTVSQDEILNETPVTEDSHSKCGCFGPPDSRRS